MKRIAIDMDEVLADSNLQFINWYERDYQIRILPEHLAGKDFRAFVPSDHQAAVRKYPQTIGFFKDMAVMQNSQEVLFQLSKKYELFITTAAMEFPTSFVHKYEWLQEHFPFIPWTHFVYCGDKSILRADYLIDDHVKHLKNFVGQGILFTAPNNIYEQWTPRVNNWQEVAKLFL
jgi:5'-nucleotidase